MEVWTVGPWGETPFRRRAIARASAGCWDFHGGLVGSGPSLPAPINPPICTPALPLSVTPCLLKISWHLSEGAPPSFLLFLLLS